MSIDWAEILQNAIEHLTGTGFRAVESQSQGAGSGKLVDTLDELAVLEECLDSVKPKIPTGFAGNAYNFLLTTPFRYPPLDYGSRFGHRSQMGILYASKDKHTALCEGAYYGLLFYEGMASPPPDNLIEQSITLFSFDYDTPKGLSLTSKAFADYQEVLTHPSEYQQTQALGDFMRRFGVVGFEYFSARSNNSGINLGFFHPECFSHNSLKTQSWVKHITANQVSYYAYDSGHSETTLLKFPRHAFVVGGELPKPAS